MCRWRTVRTGRVPGCTSGEAEPDKFWAKFMDLSKTSKVKAGTDDDTPRDPAEASLDSILLSVGNDE